MKYYKRRDKIISQIDWYTCGAVALYNAMVLLGMNPPKPEKVKAKCRTKRKTGTSVSNLLKAAKFYGLKHKKCKRRTKKYSVYLVLFEVSKTRTHFVVSHNRKLYNIGTLGKPKNIIHIIELEKK